MNVKRMNNATYVILLFSFLWIPIKSIAFTTEYKFEGIVTFVEQYYPDGTFNVGDSVFGTFIYDSSFNVDQNQDNSAIGIFRPITSPASFSVGSFDYTSDPPTTNSVLIWNDHVLHTGETLDAFRVTLAQLNGPQIDAGLYGVWDPWSLILDLVDPSLTVFATDALPDTIPGLENFDLEHRSRGFLVYREWDDIFCSLCEVQFFVTRLSPITVEDLLQELIDAVTDLNLRNGITNSLDAKLDAALNALDDLNNNNDAAAVNSLMAFISAVEAQRGKAISDEDANALIAKAQAIIDKILG